ncbi:restriction endonuclease, partial [uncultured Thiodictyon sp.]|uniref:restriction endonuclease n=1 Tax=uncultured Thiodictyon sp. TaxID=1846217 RepID=UPI0025CBD9D0
AGVQADVLSDLQQRVDNDRQNINKFAIVRTVLERINEKEDSTLRERREIIKRVAEFENFSSCWSEDQLKAKGLVSEVQRVVNVKDSFTRINQEREKERQERAENSRKEIAATQERRKRIDDLKQRLYILFPMDNEPQKRGKLLESVVNDLFTIYEISIRKDFKRVDASGAGVIEQIDGVIEFKGQIYLVEMKWLKEAIGVDSIGQHLVRLYQRDGARALFIAANGYADTTISECREALDKKIIALLNLDELVMMLEAHRSLTDLLDKKIQAAIVDKNPYQRVLS